MTLKEVEPTTAEKKKIAADGSIIEGLGVGGNVFIVSKDPEFMRDIFPYFNASIVLFVSHIVRV